MITSPYLEQISLHHQFQGNTNNCGPFCAATTLNILKQTKINGDDLGKAMERVSWRKAVPVIRRFKNWATFPWGIKDVLKENQVHAQWLLFQNTRKLVQMLPEDSILIVLIGNYFPTWSHYKILGAFDDALGLGFIDSAFRSSELQWDTQEYFEKQWRYFGNQVIRIFNPELAEYRK